MPTSPFAPESNIAKPGYVQNPAPDGFASIVAMPGFKSRSDVAGSPPVLKGVKFVPSPGHLDIGAEFRMPEPRVDPVKPVAPKPVGEMTPDELHNFRVAQGKYLAEKRWAGRKTR